jgi:hypothetical protein
MAKSINISECLSLRILSLFSTMIVPNAYLLGPTASYLQRQWTTHLTYEPPPSKYSFMRLCLHIRFPITSPSWLSCRSLSLRQMLHPSLPCRCLINFPTTRHGDGNVMLARLRDGVLDGLGAFSGSSVQEIPSLALSVPFLALELSGGISKLLIIHSASGSTCD